MRLSSSALLALYRMSRNRGGCPGLQTTPRCSRRATPTLDARWSPRLLVPRRPWRLERTFLANPYPVTIAVGGGRSFSERPSISASRERPGEVRDDGAPERPPRRPGGGSGAPKRAPNHTPAPKTEPTTPTAAAPREAPRGPPARDLRATTAHAPSPTGPARVELAITPTASTNPLTERDRDRSVDPDRPSPDPSLGASWPSRNAPRVPRRMFSSRTSRGRSTRTAKLSKLARDASATPAPRSRTLRCTSISTST